MENSRFHIVMFPWFAVGHMTPYIHISNKLAEFGFQISFLLPKKAQILLQHLNLHPNLITFYPLTIPHVDGLPPGSETASDVPIFLTHLIAIAMDHTRDQVEKFITYLKPHFVFYDCAHWVPEITSKLGIKSICYNVVCAAAIAIALVPARKVCENRGITEEDLKSPPVGYPSSKVALRGQESSSLSFISLPFGEKITFYERTVTAMKQCDAIAIRTCEEIEGNFCEYIGKQYEKAVFLTGPVLPEQGTEQLEDRWANWLNKFEKSSVIFCAFGSQIVLEKDQFQELLLGLELTKLPFLVAVKPPTGFPAVEEAFPAGFEERIKDRGIVYGGWIQQPLIIGHKSVGCFVSHCGFGSMWESLLSDCQIVMVPHLADQVLGTRLMTEELKVGVEVKREEGRHPWFSKESLSEAIKEVMDEGSEVGVMVRKNHGKWKEMLGNGGFMNGYIDRFIQNLEGLVKK